MILEESKIKEYEWQIQKAVFQWAALNEAKMPALKLLSGSMNGVKLTSALAGKRAKEQGLKKGFPDIFLPVPNGLFHGLFIELKTLTGKQTPEQKWWLKELEKQGYCAVVCHGYDDTIETIITYLC